MTKIPKDCIIYPRHRGIPRSDRKVYYMTITFVGHSYVRLNDAKERVKEEIIKNITISNTVTCYLGGYGNFDEICAYACKELKKEGFLIKTVYVTPYITPREQEKIKYMQLSSLYDESLYPPLENVLPKFAISKRNEWMITNADLIIAYVNHSYGGAYKTLKIAKRRKKKIVNICDFE